MWGNNFRSQGGYQPGNALPPIFHGGSDALSVSPTEKSSQFDDQYESTGGSNLRPQIGQMSTMILHNPKRPYRQRRKDPSCDACRERKVKCDATETTSCTECSSRNVRCQFTKDTNRRMSSIRQVQDLERQLLDAKQQLERYRTLDSRSEPSSALSRSPSESLSELPTLGKSPRRMLKAKTPQDLALARANLSNFGRGLLKPAVTSSAERSPETVDITNLNVPSKEQAEILIQGYLQGIHRKFPVVYWPEFRQLLDNVYTHGCSSVLNRDSIGLLFAAFACGGLHTDYATAAEDGQRFIERAKTSVNLWDDAFSTTQATTAFLISVFLFETNRKSAAWVWLSGAIRMVQDKGYHVQGGQWSTAEGEMRKRVWYSFYIWDRLLSLELGKPMLIDDDECDTEYPDSLDEEIDGSDDALGIFQPTLLLAAVHVARLMSPLSRLFRSLCITSQTLHKFEAHLYHCLYLLPRPLQLPSQTTLDPLHLSPVLYFQNTRLLLHRHNISPACSGEQRLQAINQCIFTAQDTAATISRTLAYTDGLDWQCRMIQAASGLLCTHLWRCMLFLIFRQLYEPFFILFKAASAIGDRRVVNVSCGRFLLFFIENLIQRFEQGRLHDLEQDEELLVYLSGDAQAGPNGWVWGNVETGTLLSRRQKHGRPRHSSQEQDTEYSPEGQMSWSGVLTPEEKQIWGGWPQVDRTVRHLKQVSERATSKSSQQSRITLAPISFTQESSTATSGRDTRSNSPPDSSKSRMTIANII